MHDFTPIVIVRITRIGTRYQSAMFPNEPDFTDKRGEFLYVLPMAECVEMPHLLMPPIQCADGVYRHFGNILFPYVSAALKKRGVFNAPQAANEKSRNAFTYSILSPPP